MHLLQPYSIVGTRRYSTEIHIGIGVGDVRSKDLKRSILKILDDGESYGYDVHKKLMREGVKVEISRLYRVLNEMLKENYLTGRWEKSVIGPRREPTRLGREGLWNSTPSSWKQ